MLTPSKVLPILSPTYDERRSNLYNEVFMKTISLKLEQAMYDWVYTFAKENDLSASQVIRLCIRSHGKYKPNNVSPDPTPKKPERDPDEVGVDGLTHAERAAVYAKMDANKDKPWEPPPPVALKTPNIVRPQQDILSAWDGE